MDGSAFGEGDPGAAVGLAAGEQHDEMAAGGQLRVGGGAQAASPDDAAAGAAASAAAAGSEKKKRKSKPRLTVQTEVLDRLKVIAAERDMSASELAEELLTTYLDSIPEHELAEHSEDTAPVQVADHSAAAPRGADDASQT